MVVVMGDVFDFIKYCYICNCYWCDVVYGEGVVKVLGLIVEDVLKVCDIDFVLG